VPIILLALPPRGDRLINARLDRPGRVEVLSAPAERPMLVPTPYFEDFESGTGGWTESATTAYAQWQHVIDPDLTRVHADIYNGSVLTDMVVLGEPAPAYLPVPHSGRSCWWYGCPENGTFIGEPFDHSPLFPLSGGGSYAYHGGSLTSPLFETSDLGSITFSFWTWWEVECIDIDNFDMMFIEASSDLGITWDTLNWLNPPFARLTGWDEYESYSSGGWLEPGVWIKWTYFLEPEWTGHDIMLRFEFNTMDGLFNGFRGWFIDDVYVSGGIEEPHLYREGEYPDTFEIVDCMVSPNPFDFDFLVANIGGEAASDVILDIGLPSGMALSSGFDIVTLGTMLPDDTSITHWEILIDPEPVYDTTYCWDVILTSADSLVGYFDDFEGIEPLFMGDLNFDYCDVRLAGGPDDAVSGLGVAGIPSADDSLYGGLEEAYLISIDFDLSGWTEAYIAFWYWLDVHYDPLWSTEGEDGFLVEYNVDHTGWNQLDEFGVGLLLPRYDAYIEEFSLNPLVNRMVYCIPTEGDWVQVVSQDLIEMGVFAPGDIVQFRFIFGSDNMNHGEGLFIDDFRLSTMQYPVGPFLHTFCIDVPGPHTPFAEVVMPLDSSSSSCPCQAIVLNAGGESLLDSSRIVIWADGTTRFAFEDGNMEVITGGGVILVEPVEPDCWSEGWHDLAMDTCYNTLGCNISPTLHWSFLSDQTAPDVVLIDPADSLYHNRNSDPLTAGITDTLTGVNEATLGVIFCGTVYDISHPAVQWDGSELIFFPDSTGTGFTWEDCGTCFCIIAGDSPDLCEPNIDTTCFPIEVDYSVPWGALVAPPIDAISACEYQDIVIALFDSGGIDPDGAEILVDGNIYISGVDPEAVISSDVLTFTPSIPWTHGQTVDFGLQKFFNIFGTMNADTITSRFVVDLQPPVVMPLAPQPDELLTTNDFDIDFTLQDAPAGLSISSIQVVFLGDTFGLSEIAWNGDSESGSVRFDPSDYGLYPNWGDTIGVDVFICDSPDLCEPNCTTITWIFSLEPQTVCRAYPNPFSPDGNSINDRIYFDYPHRYIKDARLVIFDIRNIKVFEREIGIGELYWDGTDNLRETLAPGLYIYIIENESKIICNGTLILVR